METNKIETQTVSNEAKQPPHSRQTALIAPLDCPTYTKSTICRWKLKLFQNNVRIKTDFAKRRTSQRFDNVHIFDIILGIIDMSQCWCCPHHLILKKLKFNSKNKINFFFTFLMPQRRTTKYSMFFISARHAPRTLTAFLSNWTYVQNQFHTF